MPAPRPLYLYKAFHSKNCTVHKTKLSPSQKRFYRHCDCFIWITGVTAKGEFVPRQSTGLRDWPAAEAYLADINKQIVAEIVQGDQGTTVESATKKFRDAHQRKVKPKVLESYELVLRRLTKFAAGNGVTFVKDLTYDLCADFVTYGLDASDNTKSTYNAKLKKFLKEAYKREWIKKDIAKQLDSIPAVYEAGEPYSDEELATIFTAAEKLNGGTTGYATNGKTFRLLLEFMVETGLRVSDAVRYSPGRCSKSKTGMWKYTYIPTKQPKRKQPKVAITFLSERLKTAIDESKWFSEKFPFAYNGLEDDKHERAVYERMQAIGQRSEPKIDACRPHRLRDTFAVKMLLKGLALDDVSRLLAHSDIRVTQRHYAKWTVGREDRLELLVHQALQT
jgi:integrase/recombinase XerD